MVSSVLESRRRRHQPIDDNTRTTLPSHRGGGRNISRRNKNKSRCSMSSLILCGMMTTMLIYFMVVLISLRQGSLQQSKESMPSNKYKQQDSSAARMLTAYMEPLGTYNITVKPLPPRTTTKDDLHKREFPGLSSCSRLPEQWPVDDYPEDDPFLPWIHDVFPTHDGKFIQFVAQNKRRCKTGTKPEDYKALKHTEPQITLFQHVPIKRVQVDNNERYRLATHEDADPDAIATRFICRFSSSNEDKQYQTTFSVFNFDYEWASYRKHQKVIFHEHGRDNKQVHTSQLLFKCPVPAELQETIQNGSSVIDDYATLFVDLIPIRTPPRYGSPTAYLQPYYTESIDIKGKLTFDAKNEWGTNHILPTIENSGRWANIPICKTSLMSYYNDETPKQVYQDSSITKVEKKHRLASCLWASAGYATRGDRFAINDGQRRLLEWITYKQMIGVEHFYLYDNSGAFSDQISLKGIVDMFPPGLITVIDWPSQVCNNNPNNVDSVGERSSQYAAEASCRLRFGPHVDWMAQLDIDEYLVPMGEMTSLTPLLDKLDKEGTKIISFGSWRAWPRRRLIETPKVMFGVKDCGRNQRCFQLKIPMNYTMLQAYNCDRQKPGQKTKQMPAEKQLYRPDYVLHHFIHYSTVTTTSNMNQRDVQAAGLKWDKFRAFPDQLARFGDEVTEGLMIHTKAVATQDTIYWETTCKATYQGRSMCRLGSPYPEDTTSINETEGDDGWKFNCYVNSKVENYFVPHLEEALKVHIPELANRLDEG